MFFGVVFLKVTQCYNIKFFINQKYKERFYKTWIFVVIATWNYVSSKLVIMFKVPLIY